MTCNTALRAEIRPPSDRRRCREKENLRCPAWSARRPPRRDATGQANAITAHAFRNGFLEDLHAGHWSPVLSDPGWSRISDAEMKKLMIETSARLAHWLYVRELLLDERPDIYLQLLSTVRRMFTRRWERRARACDLPDGERGRATFCSACRTALQDAWRFCPLCGSARKV